MIKVVSFDIGGTLLEDLNDNPNKYNLKELTKLVNIPYENVRDVYKNVFQKSNGTLSELVEKFCNDLGINNTEILNSFFVGKFSNNKVNSTISSDKITLIKDLKKNGYRGVFRC